MRLGRPKIPDSEKKKWDDALICDICNVSYLRSNKPRHNKSRLHILLSQRSENPTTSKNYIKTSEPSESSEETTQIVLSNSQTLNNINNFRLDENTGNSCVIFGSSKRGKSTLMMHIYKKFYEKNKNFISTLYAGNRQIGMYKKGDKLLVTEGFVKKSENYIKLQKYINSQTNNEYKFLNMFDDIIDGKYKALVNNLILTYRNADISTIMCLQYTYLLSKMNRANVNNIIIFGCNNDAAIKDMIDTFLKSFFINMNLVSYKDQYNYFKDVTNKYGFFYIDVLKNILTTHRILNK